MAKKPCMYMAASALEASADASLGADKAAKLRRKRVPCGGGAVRGSDIERELPSEPSLTRSGSYLPSIALNRAAGQPERSVNILTTKDGEAG